MASYSSDSGAGVSRILERKTSRKGRKSVSLDVMAAEAGAEDANGACEVGGGAPFQSALLHELIRSRE